ncbi:MAG: cytochrome c oxidase assembly factor Coa1 family protein [Acidobacteriota bacterium]|nr:cytochrome c oxidase assembly factor Coa1 family protein [Acidobacteriota bacterium]
MAQPAKKSGCGKIILIIAIILLVLGGGLAVAIYFGYQFAERTLKSSEAYTVAVNALKRNEEVKEHLGEIKDTGFPLGAYSTSADGSGTAAFVMSVEGTKAKGQYEVNLIRSNSVWRLTKGVVRTDGGQTVNISNQSSDREDGNLNSNADIDINTDENVASGTTIKGGVLNGKAISLPKPAYPPIAKQTRASGTIVVQVLVDEKGNVVSARALSGHPLLQAASVVAARGAKFSPTKAKGKPVKVSGVIRYNFTEE